MNAAPSPEHVQPLGPLRLRSGALLPGVVAAYAAYGRLAADGRNAVLVTHGYTASHRMLAHGDGVAEGSWAPLIGPGRVLDTDRYFIVCTNMLGSCYGSTGPASTDPRTGAPYGPDFPEIALADIVAVQHRLLRHLGVRHLQAVVGPSYGGFQALQWALDQPAMVGALGLVVTAPCLPYSPHMNMPDLMAALQADPAWHGGRYHAHGGLFGTLRRLRIATLEAYGMQEVLAAQGLAAPAQDARIAAMAGAWAREFDAHALVALLRAAEAFDVRGELHRIRCPVLHVVASTDRLFPPDAAIDAAMATLGGPLRALRIETPFGHQASGPAHAQWSGALRDLLAEAARGG